VKPSRVTSRSAFAWRKPRRPPLPDCHAPGNWHVIATRGGVRTILSSRPTLVQAEALAAMLRGGGIEAAVSVERDGGGETGEMTP
jgi:hypothetical protein